MLTDHEVMELYVYGTVAIAALCLAFVFLVTRR